jgi:LmbE family N-acetylglucosaminyl deacetylase
MKKLIIFILSLSILGLANAQAPKSYTSSEILLQLKKLNTVGSVLYIAAHPDDENTRLIAYLANEKCLRTGYLSLTRGDGGQNLIGSEQGIELGMIRTQELLAARRIDGGEQFFTRAYDFGFSKNPEETFTKWSHDSILSDMVWVIRNFRPDIIITRFATDGSGGHGHHTASAILAEEAFDAAADPTRFPEQLQYVSVWKTRRMFWNVSTRFANPNADMSPYIKLDVGGYNPLLGKSYGEIAAESRSMHKSQGFGSAKQRGESFEFFKSLKGDTTGLKDIFEGIDFTWKRIEGGEKIGKDLNLTIKKFDHLNPSLIVSDIDRFINQIRDLKGIDWIYENSYNTVKVYEANEIIANCTGLFSEALVSSPNYSIGDSVKMIFNFINRGKIRITLGGFIYNGYDGHGGLPSEIFLKKDSIYTFKNFLVDKKPYTDSALIMPYWLYFPIKNSQFQIGQFLLTESNYRSRGFLNDCVFDLNEKFSFSFYRKFFYKWVDPEKGELYRPLVITPPVMLNLTQKSFVFTDEKPKEIKVIVKAGKDNVKGVLSLKSDSKLNEHKIISEDKNNPKVALAELTTFNYSPISYNFELAKKGDEKIFTFQFKAPINQSTSSTINFTAEIDGVEYTKGIKEIKYDHIPVQTWFPEAEAKLVKVDVKKTFNTVGYIQGAGDEVPASLEQMGYKVVIITDEQLQNGNLNEFPAIVLGVRAFNTNEKLQQYKQRVFDYVKDGGNLIVQYNTNSFFGPLKDQISPVPFKLSRDRVTIEEAPVTFLLPEHPVLTFPNKITNTDFDGWIQERGIYFATEIDNSFECPLSMNDPGEKPNKGSLIIAKYGKGNYVYTGLAFFRELPAGVPGAYRLFANILSLPKNMQKLPR